MSGKKTTLTIRLDPVEKMRIKRWAQQTGHSMSEYVMEAVRERLARDEVPLEDKTAPEQAQSGLNRDTPLKVEKKSEAELEKKSLSELIKDYVSDDDTAF